MAEIHVNGAAIKALREALGLPGSNFATDQVGISHGYLSNIEAGRKQPPVDIARRIAAGLAKAHAARANKPKNATAPDMWVAITYPAPTQEAAA